MKIQLDNGNTVEVTKTGEGFDCHLMNPEGESIATVFVEDGKRSAHPLGLYAEAWYRMGDTVGKTTASREAVTAGA